jgi:predicted PhzF superfamily epimerase YddE/YHI9
METTGLTAAEMQAMTRETKFSECTFVQPAGTDVRLRIFGPTSVQVGEGRLRSS